VAQVILASDSAWSGSSGSQSLARPAIAFFSRGRGSGHAITDMALIKEVLKSDNDVEIHWVSYGTGARTLKDNGYNVIDLGLPDQNAFLETQLRATRILAKLKPHLVLCHEEFSALPAAKVFGLPTVLITDYFVDHRHIWMQCLAYADEIVFIDDAGNFDEPPYSRGKVHYVGPLVREFTYSLQDRDRARKELGVQPNTKMFLALPGNWFTENRAPLFDLVLSAFCALPFPDKVLVWFAGVDYDLLAAHERKHPDLIVKNVDWQIERWMVACDLAITKATRKTSIELACLGVPSISLSRGLNPIDDLRVSRLSTNTHIDVNTVDAGTLVGLFERVLSSTSPRGCNPPLKSTGRLAAAQRIAYHIGRVTQLRA
jgi:UDP-N-acetylglucosamine:LPS N-acetylglucosamine transferase